MWNQFAGKRLKFGNKFFIVWFIVLSLFIFGYAGAAEEELSKDDLEIIEYLDLLDSLDLLKEDLTFLEDYEDIDQFEYIGESDE